MAMAQPMDGCGRIDARALGSLLDDEINGALGEGTARPPSGLEHGCSHRRLKSWLNDMIAYRESNERGGRREVELAHDGMAVRFNGLETDVQETGNLLVGVALRDQLDYAAFPVRQGRSLPSRT